MNYRLDFKRYAVFLCAFAVNNSKTKTDNYRIMVRQLLVHHSVTIDLQGRVEQGIVDAENGEPVRKSRAESVAFFNKSIL